MHTVLAGTKYAQPREAPHTTFDVWILPYFCGLILVPKFHKY